MATAQNNLSETKKQIQETIEALESIDAKTILEAYKLGEAIGTLKMLASTL